MDGRNKSIGSRAVFPVFRMPVEMGDRHNEDVFGFNSVDYTVREQTCSAAPRMFAQQLPGFRQVLDSFDRRPNFVPELRTQSWTLGFVKPDSVPKLSTCDFKESNCHRSSNSLKTTSAGTASI
jgi:hypothetical protein